MPGAMTPAAKEKTMLKMDAAGRPSLFLPYYAAAGNKVHNSIGAKLPGFS